MKLGTIYRFSTLKKTIVVFKCIGLNLVKYNKHWKIKFKMQVIFLKIFISCMSRKDRNAILCHSSKKMWTVNGHTSGMCIGSRNSQRHWYWCYFQSHHSKLDLKVPRRGFYVNNNIYVYIHNTHKNSLCIPEINVLNMFPST